MADPGTLLVTIHTEIDKNDTRTFELASLTGAEEISKPFSLELKLLAWDDKTTEDDVAKIVGKSATINFPLSDGKTRHIHGIICKISQEWDPDPDPDSAPYSFYNATLVPALWLLSRSRTSRIFQDKSVREILEIVLDKAKIEHYDLSHLNDKDYLRRDYCVQYRETDLDFISRLMEYEGIHYYFVHEEKKHTLVISDDSVKANPDCLGENKVDGRITKLKLEREIRSGKFTHIDYEFSDPKHPISGSKSSTVADLAHKDRETHDHTMGVVEISKDGTGSDLDGLVTAKRIERLNQIRLEEEESKALLTRGESTCLGFVAGHLFEMPDRNKPKVMKHKKYLLTRVEHDLDQPFVEPGSGPDDTNTVSPYTNTFVAISNELKYRPPRLTETPLIEGPQTAVVEGPDGRKAYADKYGRIKVRFLWDTENDGKAANSGWIRVSQAWASKGYGAVFLPQCGDEVVVDFINGEPDRPLVTGCVYNGANLPARGSLDKAETGELNENNSIFQDRDGNEIIINSAEGDDNKGYIRLYSTTGNALLQIGEYEGGGKGIQSYTEDSAWGFTKGDKYSGTWGKKWTFTGNHKATADVGASTSVVLGGRVTGYFGYDAGLHVGPKFSYRYGADRSNSTGNKTSLSDKNNILTADEIVNIVGGKGEKSNSILEMTDKIARLSLGDNTDPKLEDHSKAMGRAMVIGAVLSAIVLPGASVLAGETSGKKAKEDWEIAEYAMQALTAVYALYLGFSHKDTTSVTSHGDDATDDPKAIMEITKDGDVGRADIAANGSVELRATSKLPHMAKTGRAPVKDGPGLELRLKAAPEVHLVLDSKDKKNSHLTFIKQKAELAGKQSLTLKAGQTIKVEVGGHKIIFNKKTMKVANSLLVTK